jgi:hypothetical protein
MNESIGENFTKLLLHTERVVLGSMIQQATRLEMIQYGWVRLKTTLSKMLQFEK